MMKAKFVNEVQHFERGIDPKESMNIGKQEIRKINNSFKKIQDIISSGFDVGEMDFPDMVESIDNLKDSILIIIINYFKKNFGWEFVKTDLGRIKADVGNGYEVEIEPSNSLKSYTLKLYRDNDYIGTMTASSSLRALDAKARVIIKEKNI